MFNYKGVASAGLIRGLIARAPSFGVIQFVILTLTAAMLYPGERPGIPCCVPKDVLALMTGLDGDRGAGPLLRQLHGLRLVDPQQHELRDVDTAEDLASIAALFGR